MSGQDRTGQESIDCIKATVSALVTALPYRGDERDRCSGRDESNGKNKSIKDEVRLPQAYQAI